MSDEVVRSKHAELSWSEVADALPSTGEIMASVGRCWWRCAYAARGGNWPLAAYYARRVRGLQRTLAVTRPKHRERLERFEAGPLASVFRAIEAADRGAFELTFKVATDVANEMHVDTGHAYIRWVLPDEPPKDMDLGS